MNKNEALKELQRVEERLNELKRIIKDNNKTLDDITSVYEAQSILNEIDNSTNLSDYDKLLIIIKATNFIDNGYKIWIPNFEDDTYKYIPYLQKKNGAWSLVGVVYGCRDSVCPIGLYYMKESSAKLMINRFISLYNKVWG